MINGTYLYPTSSFFVQNNDKVNQRAYFYLGPSEECKSKKYLISKQQVMVYMEYGKFYLVMYIDNEGKNIQGWLNSDKVNLISYLIMKISV